MVVWTTLPPELTATNDKHVATVVDALTRTNGVELVPVAVDDDFFYYSLRVPKGRI